MCVVRRSLVVGFMFIHRMNVDRLVRLAYTENAGVVVSTVVVHNSALLYRRENRAARPKHTAVTEGIGLRIWRCSPGHCPFSLPLPRCVGSSIIPLLPLSHNQAFFQYGMHPCLSPSVPPTVLSLASCQPSASPRAPTVRRLPPSHQPPSELEY